MPTMSRGDDRAEAAAQPPLLLRLPMPLLLLLFLLSILASKDDGAPLFLSGAAALSASSAAPRSSGGSNSIYETIRAAKVLDPTSAEERRHVSPLDDEDLKEKDKTLVVLLPQLGEFDSSEFCEFLVAAFDALEENGIGLRVVGIGDEKAAREFCQFTGLPLAALRVDPDASIHRALNLRAGPGLGVPDAVSDGVLRFLLKTLPGGAPSDDDEEVPLRPLATAWLNYLAMCAGIGAPGTLREILRGYFGDLKAPERFREDDVVEAGFVKIGPGVGPVKIGPLAYEQWFADERGYQRPVELATVRLKNMVEVLTKWDLYVTNPLAIAQRGATYLFDNRDGSVLYLYEHRGVLTYSETMPRPLTFLAPYVGEAVARNPLKLPDTGGGELKRGRGFLKPAGKAMGLLGSLFKVENRLQARLLGAEEADLAAARKEIEATIASSRVVIYTYGLSPFSAEAIAVLDEIGGVDYRRVELGPEWFLLDKRQSAIRAALLEMTGQSSLPHIFIDGGHIGGLFTGPPKDGSSPHGLAGLKESGELQKMLQ